ncbi:MAG: Xaa-Pro peptidase family protein [Candidatus Acidiferrales bacterium]
MRISRRDLLKSGATTLAVGAISPLSDARMSGREASAIPGPQATALPPAFNALRPLGDRVHPITPDERKARVARAQELMTNAKPQFSALFITPGTALFYFTGIRWWPSERILALLIPRSGEPILISAAFEEGRLRESLPWPIEIRTWEEDESPYDKAAHWLTERHLQTGRIGVEETTRFMFFDGLRKANPYAEYLSGDPITISCRARKSEHELNLMRLACTATCDVYKATFASLHEGVTQQTVSEWISQGYNKMGLEGEAMVLFGAASSFPHGSQEGHPLREGDSVLLDDGTTVEGYQSDVTRMSVLGKPSEKLQRGFEIVRKAQDAALAAAVAGKRCGSVDDAARRVITDARFGPGYKYFAHRVGHGIGLDMHEQPYLVRGNRTILASGMTFSNEPGIYVPGDYGVRCEDDMVITADGPAQLLTPGFQPSLEVPVA